MLKYFKHSKSDLIRKYMLIGIGIDNMSYKLNIISQFDCLGNLL